MRKEKILLGFWILLAIFCLCITVFIIVNADASTISGANGAEMTGVENEGEVSDGTRASKREEGWGGFFQAVVLVLFLLIILSVIGLWDLVKIPTITITEDEKQHFHRLELEARMARDKAREKEV